MPRPCKLTFDLLTLKVVSESRVTWATSVPILVFLYASLLQTQARCTRQTDRQTSSNAHHPCRPCRDFPHIYLDHHAKFGFCFSYYIVHTRLSDVPKIWGRRDGPLGMGRGWSTRIMLLPHMGYHTKLGRGSHQVKPCGRRQGVPNFLGTLSPVPLDDGCG